MPQLYMIIPVGLDGARPDQGLPPGHEHPGNRPPGSWGGPVDPGFGQGDRPNHPWWGGTGWDRPDQGLPGGGHPSGQPIIPPQGGTEVPADEYQPLPPPEDIYSQYVVSVWNPKTASWTTKSYPPR